MADEMPMIPGLMGGADFPGAEDDGLPPETPEGDGIDVKAELTNELNALDATALSDLLVEVDEALMAGELDELLAAAPAEIEGESPAEGGDASDVENEAPLGEDPAIVIGAVNAMIEEATGLQQRLNELSEAADESDGELDVSDAVATVEEALDELQTALSDAEQADADVDPDAAADAKKAAEEALAKAKEAHDEAVGEGQDAAEAIGAEVEPDALELWAERNA